MSINEERRIAVGRKELSIIGENSFFQGKFYIQDELQIDGRFEGTALFTDTLVIGKKGKVKSDINANNVMIEGIVIGNIAAKNSIMLLPSARVLGNIKTPELIIQNGVVLEGKCTISSDDLEKSPQELITKQYEEKS